MRPLALLAGATATIALALGVSATAANAAEVTVPDAGLAACINENLGQNPTDPISDAQAASLTKLDCSIRDISDLTGLEAFTNLTSFTAPYNKITNIAPVASLTKLTYLDFGDNPGITSLAPLSGLTELDEMILTRTGPHADLTPLKPLKKLRLLSLYDTGISDITPLADLDNLWGADLDLNQITDLSPLSGLTKLTSLGLSNNQISDVSPLSSIATLRYLNLENNHIADMSPLTGVLSNFIGPNTNYLYAQGQTVALDPIAVGNTQQSSFIGFAGDILPVTPNSAGFDLAADGKSWKYATASIGNTAAWAWSDSTAFNITFSGTMTQTSTPRATAPTTLTDDTATTKQNTAVVIDVLANDGKPGEPALDPSTLTLLDSSGNPAMSVSVAGGEFTVQAGKIQFVPAAGFTGAVPTVKYRVANADGLTADANITVTVAAGDAGGSNGGSNGNANAGGGGTGAGVNETGASTEDAALATTGSDSPWLAAGIAGLVLLLGAAATVWARLRRA